MFQSPPRLDQVARFLIAGVWLFHGLYSKVLDGIPRHRLIVGRVLGDEWAKSGVMTIGALEICLGLWALSGRWRVGCAAVQTTALITMNTLEILNADDLLISAVGMIVLNVAFQTLVWLWALRRGPFRVTDDD